MTPYQDVFYETSDGLSLYARDYPGPTAAALSVFWFLSSEVEAALTTKATPLATPSCNTLRICTAY